MENYDNYLKYLKHVPDTTKQDAGDKTASEVANKKKALDAERKRLEASVTDKDTTIKLRTNDHNSSIKTIKDRIEHLNRQINDLDNSAKAKVSDFDTEKRQLEQAITLKQSEITRLKDQIENLEKETPQLEKKDISVPDNLSKLAKMWGSLAGKFANYNEHTLATECYQKSENALKASRASKGVCLRCGKELITWRKLCASCDSDKLRKIERDNESAKKIALKAFWIILGGAIVGGILSLLNWATTCCHGSSAFFLIAGGTGIIAGIFSWISRNFLVGLGVFLVSLFVSYQFAHLVSFSSMPNIASFFAGFIIFGITSLAIRLTRNI